MLFSHSTTTRQYERQKIHHSTKQKPVSSIFLSHHTSEFLDYRLRDKWRKYLNKKEIEKSIWTKETDTKEALKLIVKIANSEKNCKKHSSVRWVINEIPIHTIRHNNQNVIKIRTLSKFRQKILSSYLKNYKILSSYKINGTSIKIRTLSNHSFKKKLKALISKRRNRKQV